MKRLRIPNVVIIPLVLVLTLSTSCATLFNPVTQNSLKPKRRLVEVTTA